MLADNVDPDQTPHDAKHSNFILKTLNLTFIAYSYIFIYIYICIFHTFYTMFAQTLVFFSCNFKCSGYMWRV